MDMSAKRGAQLHLDNRSLCVPLEIYKILYTKKSRNSNYVKFVQLCYTEFREIQRNFRKFRTEYRRCGSAKNMRISLPTEFRGHPFTYLTLLGVHKLLCLFSMYCIVPYDVIFFLIYAFKYNYSWVQYVCYGGCVCKFRCSQSSPLPPKTF
jgi:hypothetical protein